MKQYVSKFLLIASLAVFTGDSLPAQQQYTKDEVVAQILLNSLEKGHYSPIEVNDELSKRTFTLLLKRMDYNKNFLLQQDVAKLRAYETQIDDELRRGTNELFVLSNTLLQQRIKEAQAYTEDILSHPFDFSTNEYFELDPEKRDFAKSEDDLKDMWRRMLKYQALLRYIDLVDDREKSKADVKGDGAVAKTDEELEAEARDKVLKNQNQRFERLLKENEMDRIGRYLGAVALSFEPHTEYFPPDDKENFDIAMSGSLEGIGAQLREADGYIKVESIVPGSASWKQKELKPEDIILKVAQGTSEPVDVVDMRLDDAVKLIRGKKGTEVRLTVKKPDGRITVIPITRDVVVLEETYAKSAVIKDESSEKRFGYVYLPKFYADFNKSGGRSSADDIRQELEKLKAENVDGIVLDLRNNGGGSLQDAVKMTGHFIPTGPVVQVRYSSGENEVLADTDPAVTYDGPLVVLVNNYSASASEILAAALQDYGRAVIVGSPTTFGKGTVQTFVDLDNYLNPQFAALKPLGSLKITFQKFYRINGGSTQFKGVIPDIVLPDSYSMLDIGEKELEYALPWDTIAAQNYTTWGSGANYDNLRKNSAARVASNASFKLIEENAKHMKERRDDTNQPLNMDKVRSEQAELKAESKKFEDAQQEQPHIKVSSPVADKPKESEAVMKERIDEWHKQIKKDVTIAEAMAILKDMIQK